MHIKRILSAISGGLAVAVAVPALAFAATVPVNCADLATAVDSASAGDVLQVSGNCTITSTINVDEDITIQGVGGATISTSGSSYLFLVTGDGATIEDLNIVKTDTTNQNIIGVQADDVTISGNTFSGQYDLGEGEVSRAIEVSGVENVTITDNNITHLRQPAYINTATGTVSDNYVSDTRGFVVVANSEIEFTGNTFGNNAFDIVFIDDDANPATPIENNYPCEVVQQIVKNNDNAVVQNQVETNTCPKVATDKDTCKNNGYKTLVNDDGKSFKNQGDCVSFVASQGKAKGNPEQNTSVVTTVRNALSRLF
jgi:nitrous oxidase accessory protein NosD